MSRGVKNQLAKRLQLDTAYNVNNKVLQEFAVKTLEQEDYKNVLYTFKKYMEDKNASKTRKLLNMLLPKKDTKNRGTQMQDTRVKDKTQQPLQPIPVFIKKEGDKK